jgi:conjugal transfer/entry exclusion protein
MDNLNKKVEQINDVIDSIQNKINQLTPSNH